MKRHKRRHHKPNQFIDRRSMLTGSALVAAAGLNLPVSTKAQANEKPAIIQPQTASDAAFIRRAFDMRQRAVDLGDQAYGAVIVKDDLIIGQSWSRVVVDGDPTAHAEMAAIRDAAMRNGPANLRGATMYSSSRPCPMCEAACYWAGIDGMVHGRSATNAGRPTLCW